MVKYLFLTLFIANLSLGSTDLMVHVDKDFLDNKNNVMTIPERLQDGPKNRDLEIVCADKFKTAKDNQGHFKSYSVYNQYILPILEIRHINYRKGQVIFFDPRSQKELTTTLFHGKNSKAALFRYRDFTYAFYEAVLLPCYSQPVSKTCRPLLKKIITPPEFVMNISTFGHVWSVFNMYNNVINKCQHSKTLLAWNHKKHVKIYPQMTEDVFKTLRPLDDFDAYNGQALSFYDLDNHPILCFFPLSENDKKPTSSFFDVVTHMAGHCILDIIKPNRIPFWKEIIDPCFGRMTTLFTLLNFSAVRDRLIEKTHDPLEIMSFLDEESLFQEKVLSARSICYSCHDKIKDHLTPAMYGLMCDTLSLKFRQKQTSDSLVSLLKQAHSDVMLLFVKTVIDFNFEEEGTLVDFVLMLEKTALTHPSLNYLAGFIHGHFKNFHNH